MLSRWLKARRCSPQTDSHAEAVYFYSIAPLLSDGYGRRSVRLRGFSEPDVRVKDAYATKRRDWG
jgi:hypothetical protein